MIGALQRRSRFERALAWWPCNSVVREVVKVAVRPDPVEFERAIRGGVMTIETDDGMLRVKARVYGYLLGDGIQDDLVTAALLLQNAEGTIAVARGFKTAAHEEDLWCAVTVEVDQLDPRFPDRSALLGYRRDVLAPVFVAQEGGEARLKDGIALRARERRCL